MIETAIKSLLSGDSTVTGTTAAFTARAVTYSTEIKKLVGSRIYRAQLPRNAAKLITEERNLPAIWYWRTNTERPKTHDGPISLVNATVALHAVATNTLAANQVLQQVRLLLDGWRGSAGGVGTDLIWVTEGQDYFEDPIGAAELGLAESNLVLNCWFRETLAS